MGRPSLLLAAASTYRGDLEDRLTEVFAVALSEHDGFCRRFLSRVGVEPQFVQCAVFTQEWFPLPRARLDVVIRACDSSHQQVAVVFIENKYNPYRHSRPYWFTDEQAGRQHAALASEGTGERHLVAIASDHDLHRGFEVPPQYGRKFGWREVAELAYSAGGERGWEEDARKPDAPAAQRVLLEFWAYLKGDAVGAIEHHDLEALGRIAQAEERVSALLRNVADELGWYDAKVLDDWSTGGGAPAKYIACSDGADSWLAQREGGTQYVVISNASWLDERPAGEPHLYAGAGFDAEPTKRSALTDSGWSQAVEAAGMNVVDDDAGVYMLAAKPLAEVIGEADMLSTQVQLVKAWARTAFGVLASLPEPPDFKQPERKPSTA